VKIQSSLDVRFFDFLYALFSTWVYCLEEGNYEEEYLFSLLNDSNVLVRSASIEEMMVASSEEIIKRLFNSFEALEEEIINSMKKFKKGEWMDILLSSLNVYFFQLKKLYPRGERKFEVAAFSLANMNCRYCKFIYNDFHHLNMDRIHVLNKYFNDFNLFSKFSILEEKLDTIFLRCLDFCSLAVGKAIVKCAKEGGVNVLRGNDSSDLVAMLCGVRRCENRTVWLDLNSKNEDAPGGKEKCSGLLINISLSTIERLCCDLDEREDEASMAVARVFYGYYLTTLAELDPSLVVGRKEFFDILFALLEWMDNDSGHLGLERERCVAKKPKTEERIKAKTDKVTKWLLDPYNFGGLDAFRSVAVAAKLVGRECLIQLTRTGESIDTFNILAGFFGK
jgi:hypothetical protein